MLPFLPTCIFTGLVRPLPGSPMWTHSKLNHTGATAQEQALLWAQSYVKNPSHFCSPKHGLISETVTVHTNLCCASLLRSSQSYSQHRHVLDKALRTDKTEPSARRSTFLSSKMTPTEQAQPVLEAEALPRDGLLPDLCTQGSACSVLLLTQGPAAPPALNFVTQRAPRGPTGSSAAQHLAFDLLCHRATYVLQNTT